MSQAIGNTYPTWGINVQGLVFAVDTNNGIHSKSTSANPFFYDLGISEDGHIWALSTIPDPDGGGSKIYWSPGDGSWNEINTPDPGAVRISGFTGNSCIYLTTDQILRTLDITGASSVIYNSYPVHDADYGGGMIWALLADKPGEPITLHYSAIGDINFSAFGSGQTPIDPSSISVNYQGNCYGVSPSYSPMYYNKDGSSSGSAGKGADGKTISISFKNWNYIVLTTGDVEGNDVYVWEDVAGGTYTKTSFQAVKILSSYYTP